ncbi:MAG: hypothetical protein H6730_10435 [Deltaproteobacteria bacterium]|nr:hypothetical protein [Deltaproteobacteria bacterium]
MSGLDAQAGISNRDTALTSMNVPAFAGLGAYLSVGTPVETIRVRDSGQRLEALERLEAVTRAIGVAARVRRAISAVADELLTNALYNAPVDRAGDPRHADWPRTRPVRLDAAEAAELRFGCDGECFALAVEDPFGTLAPERARQHLAESLQMRTVPVREGPGGAGLGLFEVLSSVSHLLIDVAPGRRTEVLALLDVRGGYRRLMEGPRTLDIFVEGVPA